MSNTFLRVEEVAEEMEVSKSYAYKIAYGGGQRPLVRSRTAAVRSE